MSNVSPPAPSFFSSLASAYRTFTCDSPCVTMALLNTLTSSCIFETVVASFSERSFFY